MEDRGTGHHEGEDDYSGGQNGDGGVGRRMVGEAFEMGWVERCRFLSQVGKGRGVWKSACLL